MADKNKKNTPKSGKFDKQPVEPQKSGKAFKIIAIALVLVMLAGVGFALGIYLKLIDLPGLAGKWKLYDYPVIGQYFTKPQTNFEPVDLESQPGMPDQQPGAAQPQAMLAPISPNPAANPIDNTELDKQAKRKQQEEAKRISKLARLYGGMKPDEAVTILNQLDDDTVLAILSKMEEEQVAKLMPLFDAKRAARITESMLRGQKTN